MSARGRLVPVALLVCMAFVASACSAAPDPETCAPAGMLREGDPLPDCRLPSLDGSREIALSEFRGKPLVLNFWASWCLSCLKEMPALDEFDKRHPDIQVVGVDVVGIEGETIEAGRRYYDERGVAYPSLVDDGGRLYGHFAFSSRPVMPLTVVADEAGIVRRLKFGAVDEAALETLVADATS